MVFSGSRTLPGTTKSLICILGNVIIFFLVLLTPGATLCGKELVSTVAGIILWHYSLVPRGHCHYLRVEKERVILVPLPGHRWPQAELGRHEIWGSGASITGVCDVLWLLSVSWKVPTSVSGWTTLSVGAIEAGSRHGWAFSVQDVVALTTEGTHSFLAAFPTFSIPYDLIVRKSQPQSHQCYLASTKFAWLGIAGPGFEASLKSQKLTVHIQSTHSRCIWAKWGPMRPGHHSLQLNPKLQKPPFPFWEQCKLASK